MTLQEVAYLGKSKLVAIEHLFYFGANISQNFV